MEFLLGEFEQQFASVTAEVTSKVCKLLNNPNMEAGDVSILKRDVENLINEAKELLERMTLEVREAPQDQRDKSKTRVKSYEVELKRLENEFLRGLNNLQSSEVNLRQELFDSAGLSTPEEQIQTLLSNTESLERTSNRLDQSYRVSIETEQVGAMILNDLNSQRETISRARNRLRDADDDLDQSSHVLNVMLRRVLQNKFITAVIITFVALILLLFIIKKLW